MNKKIMLVLVMIMGAVSSLSKAADLSDQANNVRKVIVEQLGSPNKDGSWNNGQLMNVAIALNQKKLVERLKELTYFGLSGTNTLQSVGIFLSKDLKALESASNALANDSKRGDMIGMFSNAAEILRLFANSAIAGETTKGGGFDAGILFHMVSMLNAVPDALIPAPVKAILNDLRTSVVQFSQAVTAGAEYAKNMATKMRARQDPQFLKSLPTAEQKNLEEQFKTPPFIPATIAVEENPFD